MRICIFISRYRLYVVIDFSSIWAISKLLYSTLQQYFRTPPRLPAAHPAAVSRKRNLWSPARSQEALSGGRPSPAKIVTLTHPVSTFEYLGSRRESCWPRSVRATILLWAARISSTGRPTEHLRLFPSNSALHLCL